MKRSLATRSVHAGTVVDPAVGGVNTPIHPSSACLWPNPRAEEICYPRYGKNPTQNAPAAKLADLEGAEAAILTGSGMGAVSAALMTFLEMGDHTVFARSLYGGSLTFANTMLGRMGVTHDYVDLENLTGERAEEALRRALGPTTKVVFFETPTNPLLGVVDMRAVADVCREHGAVSIMDNTFATPILQRPLEHGVDLVVHSGTKYLNGHSDLVCGAVAGRAELVERVHATTLSLGPALNVLDAYLLERGMKTLELRMRRHTDNARTLAHYLAGHPRVKAVYYPGLPDHPAHQVAALQMDDFGGMFSLELDMDAAEASSAVDRLELFHRAVSLGGVESLVCFPAETSHAMLSPEERAAAGVTDTLIRVSVGIEDPADLVGDFKQALS